MITRSHKNFEKVEKHYWQYYRELEDEVLWTRRYVDFEEDNFGAYSVEYLKLFQAICSEIDVIGKAIACEIDSGFKPNDKQNNIYKWWLIIQDELRFPVWNEDKLIWENVPLTDATADFYDRFTVVPWENFRTENRPNKNGVLRTEVVVGKKIPAWWSEYNKVKHQRTAEVKNSNSALYYSKANFGNVVKSISGLYVLEFSYLHAVGLDVDIEAFADNSRLFTKIAYTTHEDINAILKKTADNSSLKWGNF